LYDATVLIIIVIIFSLEKSNGIYLLSTKNLAKDENLTISNYWVTAVCFSW
jgi:hypothetical protein